MRFFTKFIIQTSLVAPNLMYMFGCGGGGGDTEESFGVTEDEKTENYEDENLIPNQLSAPPPPPPQATGEAENGVTGMNIEKQAGGENAGESPSRGGPNFATTGLSRMQQPLIPEKSLDDQGKTQQQLTVVPTAAAGLSARIVPGAVVATPQVGQTAAAAAGNGSIPGDGSTFGTTPPFLPASSGHTLPILTPRQGPSPVPTPPPLQVHTVPLRVPTPPGVPTPPPPPPVNALPVEVAPLVTMARYQHNGEFHER